MFSSFSLRSRSEYHRDSFSTELKLEEVSPGILRNSGKLRKITSAGTCYLVLSIARRGQIDVAEEIAKTRPPHF
uniref:Uncharacterized protein n=1 Tax=Caenorhabditis japonica TaxID=281687 RepID=A0A8R1IHP6_CAEJA